MSDGKLVRDRVPDLIRAECRQADVKYVRGQELVVALAEKLQEEATEVAEAIDDRVKLIEELADLTEAMNSLMRLSGIDHDTVARAAAEKTAQRGGFDAGAVLINTTPAVHPPGRLQGDYPSPPDA